MADSTKLTIDPLGMNKMALNLPVGGSRFYRMEDGSWEFARNGPTSSLDRGPLRRYSLHDPPRQEIIHASAISPKISPGHRLLGVRRYYDNEQPSYHEEQCAPSKYDEFISVVAPRRYSIEELKTIGRESIWNQGRWASWNTTSEGGGLGFSRNFFSAIQKEGIKPKALEPPSPRIKPLDQVEGIELEGLSDDVSIVLLASPAMLDLESTTRSRSVISFSDEEDLYSAEDREPRYRRRESVPSMISFDSFEIEHIENSALRSSISASSLPRNQELVVAPTHSDIGSPKSVSRSDSDIESWINEPTIEELEHRLREKSKWMKRLCYEIQTTTTEREMVEFWYKKQLQQKTKSLEEFSNKFQAAGAQIRHLQVKHKQELLAEKTCLTRSILDGNKTLIASLERIHQKNLKSLESQCNRQLLAAEETRLSELAKLEERIQKCDEEWTAERKSLIEKLEFKREIEEECQNQSSNGIPSSAMALSSRLLKATKRNRELQTTLQSKTKYAETVIEQNKVLLRDNTILQKHAWNIAENSAENPTYTPSPLEGDNVKNSESILVNTQIQDLHRQIADIAEERNSDKEMHVKLQGHYFALHSKYMAMCAQPGSLVEAQLRLAFLEADRIPELVNQIEELEREIRSRDDLHREDKEKQEARYKELLLDQNKQSKEKKRGDKSELEMLRNIKVPALVGQVSGLQKLIVSIKTQHARQDRLRDAINKALVVKHDTLSKEYEELGASCQRFQEAQNDLGLQKELQQQLADLKSCMENMEEVQKSRYDVLDTQMSSFSLRDANRIPSKDNSLLEAHAHLQSEYHILREINHQLEKSRNDVEIEKNTSEREKKCLERRLEKLESVADWRRRWSLQDSNQRQELMNFNYKLKRENLRLVRSKLSAKEIEEYLAQSVDVLPPAWRLEETNRALRAAYEKLEKAHEIAQEAHKVLESRLQMANSDLYEMQQRLNVPREFDAWSATGEETAGVCSGTNSSGGERTHSE